MTQRPSLLSLSAEMFRVMTLTVGGGSTAAAAFQRRLVDEKQWLPLDEFRLAYALGRITPGTTVFAMCSALGLLLRGFAGAVASLLAASIPSSLLAWIVTLGVDAISTSPLAQRAISGAIAASVGLSFASVWILVRPSLIPGRLLRPVALVLGGYLLSLWLTPIAVLALAAVAGYRWKSES